MRKAAAVFALVLFLLPRSAATDSGLTFIVNKDNPVQALSRNDLVDYYEKRKRQWPDGSSVRFIDREPGSPERAKFLKEILGQSESDVDLFWFAQKIHSGDSMPVQIPSDSMVIEMVKSFKGAIGYVTSSTPLSGTQVRRITISSGAKQ